MIPARAYLKNHGHVRVMYYVANGTFAVLTNRDERRFVHRNELEFLPTRRKTRGETKCTSE